MRAVLRVLVALGTVLALALPAAGVVAAAGVSISPDNGAIGSTVTLSGNGFSATKTVQVFFNGSGGTLIGAEAADSGGNINNLAATIPNVIGGTYQIFATDGTNTATTNFTVPSSLTLSPTSGAPSTAVSLSGTGFIEGEGIVVGWDAGGNQVATATANSTGGFSASFNAPSSSSGTHTVFATGQSSGFQVSAMFTVENGNEGDANVSLSPSSGRPGSNVTVTGSAFGVNESVNIAVDGGVLKSVNSDGNGNFSTAIALSSSLSSGTHTISATGVSSGRSASATFTVTSQPTTSCSGEDDRPGNGFGDRNHCHTGPPGRQGDQGEHGDRDGNGQGDHGKHGKQGDRGDRGDRGEDD